MRRLESHLVGVDQGEVQIFSDFESDGEMWSGSGPRLRRCEAGFSEPFRTPPVVHVSISLWDIARETHSRADIAAEEITEAGFTLVFRTWQDTRVARIHALWLAIGELAHPDDWELY